MTNQTSHLWLAVAATLLYGLSCLLPAYLQTRARRRLARENAQAGAAWIVAYASQTGSAEELAARTAQTLRVAGESASLCTLSDLTAEQLGQAERILFVASTYGEGDAPDDAAVFVGKTMALELDLSHLHYAVLALGDRSYAHFCGFGRTLDGWLAARGASKMAERVEVDRGASAAIEVWQQQLSHWAGTLDAPDWSSPALEDWRLSARSLLNPGSAGAPVYHIELRPVEGSLPDWQAGDLVQVAPPLDREHPRDYSIASLPLDGALHLLVRLHIHADGRRGIASGWLGEQAAVGDTVPLRVRAHQRFRLDGNEGRALILIGNGTGLAGLRAHLKERAAVAGGKPTWLIFGERNADRDFFYRAELQGWQTSGALTRLDAVFSRDQAERVYVQDRVRAAGVDIAAWVADGAAIYVCGSLEGMAGGVDDALRAVLGDATVEQLAQSGRYRRDVY